MLTYNPVFASYQVPSVRYVIEKFKEDEMHVCVICLKYVIINEMSNYFNANKKQNIKTVSRLKTLIVINCIVS